MQLTVGLESINSYKRLSYSSWYALAEFVDNSTQSYFDNRAVLDVALQKENSQLLVSILFDREAGTLTIKDNSMGMSEQELDDALKIASKPPKDGGRSKYGMGMKTAACWFGDEWSIKTKKLGLPNSFEVRVNVPEVAAGASELRPIVQAEDINQHYTEITISKLHRRIQGRAILTIKDYLRSIYRCDLRDRVMQLLFQGEPLSWEGFESKILRDSQGTPYKRQLDFEVLDKRVTGWVAVLESGGRPYGGFSLIQNNRVMTGYPEGWRPRTLFGQLQGSNDLVNQRLCGELFMDGFQVNHTKDGINWQGSEEEVLERELAIRCDDYRRKAKETRKGDKRGPSPLAINNAISQVTRELNSNEMIDALELTEIPSETVLQRTNQQTLEQATRGTPRIDAVLGDVHLKFYVNDAASPSDTYYVLDWTPDGVIEIAINQHHDYMVQLGNDISDFIRQCIYDGIAEFKATQKRGKVEPNTIRYLKDNLLRVPYKINDDSSDTPDEDNTDI